MDAALAALGLLLVVAVVAVCMIADCLIEEWRSRGQAVYSVC